MTAAFWPGLLEGRAFSCRSERQLNVAHSRPRKVQEAASPRSLLAPGENCWRRTAANRAAMLRDGASYFSALRSSLLKAQHNVLIIGWDVDSRTRLRGEAPPADGAPECLHDLLCFLVRRRPELRIRILLWDYSLLYALEREPLPSFKLGRRTPRQVTVLLDEYLPVGASHHEKLVVVDDNVAYCGGLDLTIRRWDTSAHTPTRADRCDPAGQPYAPFHDVQMLVEGGAAKILGARARERWERAGGAQFAVHSAQRDVWPEAVEPDLTQIPLGIARTIGAFEDQPEVREIERLRLAAIGSAKKFIYIENQYLASDAISRALVEQLRSEPHLQLWVLSSRECDGWLEEYTVGARRVKFMQRFQDAGLGRRVKFAYPFVSSLDDGREQIPIQIHSKVMFVDDRFLQIGSANLNRRSLGFDTECDLGFEAETEEHRQQLAEIRNRLLAEHLGTSAAWVGEALRGGDADLRCLGAAGNGRGLAALPADAAVLEALSEVGADVADPVRAVDAREFLGDMFGAKRYRSDLVRAVRAVSVIALLFALVALWTFSPLADIASVEALRQSVEPLSGAPWTGLIVLIAFLVGSLVLFPVTVLVGLTAILFGSGAAFVWASLGTLLGATATYWLGSVFGRRLLKTFLGSKVRRMDQLLGSRSLVSVALLRNVPLAPFTIVNLVIGASGISFRNYLLGTAVGMLPGIAAISFLGDRLALVWTHPGVRNIAVLGVATAAWILVVLGMQRLVGNFERGGTPR